MVPYYWKTDLETVAEWTGKATRADVRVIGKSAGGRDIWLFAYGDREELHPKANYSSACGARNITSYVDRSNKKPVVLLVGAVHGQELEGTASLMNLISLLETGKDLAGNTNDSLLQWTNQVRLLIIPVANVDGRSRVEPAAMVGMTNDEFRHWGQGNWKDGSLCGWPECKMVHPIKDAVSFLGGYFNDDGVNMMHDQMFAPQSPENRALFALMEEEMVDCVIQFHGGSNSNNVFLKTDYVTEESNEATLELTERCTAAGESEGLSFRSTYMANKAHRGTPASFNLASALHHIGGAVSIIFESNEAICDWPGPKFTYDEILRSHAIIFEQVCKMFVERQTKAAE